jgi:uncharacterized protein (TIGR00661 family)
VRILYGVQGTGNGHITRARAIAPKLRAAGAEVTWLFSGRPRQELFEMEPFGAYEWRAGLTFETHRGEVRYVRTALRNNPLQFIRDIRALDLSGYDLVVTDFEPVTAWAARLRGVRCIGVGHQYAFGMAVPKAGADFMGVQVLKYFAPVTLGLGVHWHHFGAAILPPVIEANGPALPPQPRKVIVYLPFEAVEDVIRLLKPFAGWEFHVYNPGGPVPTQGETGHIQVKGLSRRGFREDFADCGGVICNAGFELPSEALHYGKRLLVKPLHRQMEQMSNALALETLGLGQAMPELDGDTVAAWLAASRAEQPLNYPDVPAAVADWLLRGAPPVEPAWVQSIWSQCGPAAPRADAA